MQPTPNGRFCSYCQKEVYDLVDGKIPANTLDTFCGRIKIDRPTTEITFKKLQWKQNPIKYIVITCILFFNKNIKAQFAVDYEKSSVDSNKNQSDTITKSIIIRGILTDKKTKETIPFANVVVFDKYNNQLAFATTDIDGNYIIEIKKIQIKGGSISIKAVYVGYESVLIKDIPIQSSFKQNIQMSINGKNKDELIIVGNVSY